MELMPRKPGRPTPPDELLAAALAIYANPLLTREEMPGVLRRAAARMGLTQWLPDSLHPNTVDNWRRKAASKGLTPDDAGPLFQIIREGEGEEAGL